LVWGFNLLYSFQVFSMIRQDWVLTTFGGITQ
jgi:hypothetical protein